MNSIIALCLKSGCRAIAIVTTDEGETTAYLSGTEESIPLESYNHIPLEPGLTTCDGLVKIALMTKRQSRITIMMSMGWAKNKAKLIERTRDHMIMDIVLIVNNMMSGHLDDIHYTIDTRDQALDIIRILNN